MTGLNQDWTYNGWISILLITPRLSLKWWWVMLKTFSLLCVEVWKVHELMKKLWKCIYLSLSSYLFFNMHISLNVWVRERLRVWGMDIILFGVDVTNTHTILSMKENMYSCSVLIESCSFFVLTSAVLLYTATVEKMLTSVKYVYSLAL